MRAAEIVEQDCDQPGPAGLVAGADAGAIVAMKVLVEQEAVAPMRVILELPRGAEDGPPAAAVAQEGRGQTTGDLARHFEEVQLLPAAGRALDGERVPEITMVLQ